jgi:hypothetical protein
LTNPKSVVPVDDFIKNLFGHISIDARALAILILLKEGQVWCSQATRVSHLIMSVRAFIQAGEAIGSVAGLDAERRAAVEDDARVDWLEHV